MRTPRSRRRGTLRVLVQVAQLLSGSCWFIIICSRSSVGLERLPAKEEVTGSSPVGCTIRKITPIPKMGDFFDFPIILTILYWLLVLPGGAGRFIL